MKNDDLEKTIPIDVLDLEESTRSAKYKDDKKVSSRAKKYEDIDVDEEIEESEEILEEGLDDTKEVKTITDLEVEEIEEDEDEPKKGKKDKKKNGNGLIAKFKALPKKKKIFLLILCGIVVVLLTVLIVMLVLGGGKEEETKKEEEEPVKIVDNYYYKKGSLYFLDENEKEIGSYACANKDEEKCYVAYNSSDDVLDIARKYDEEGNVILERAPIIDQDYVFVYDSENEEEPIINLYSIEEEIVKEKYDSVELHEGNFVVVEEEGKKGLIKLDNGVAEVIEPTYEEMHYLNGKDYVIVKKQKGYVAVDFNDKEASKYIDSNLVIKNYNDDFIVVSDGSKYAVYNFDGEELVSGYDFATISGTFMVLVNGKELFIRDVDNIKYNEVPYKLNNETYVKKVIYDAEGNLLRKELSFEFTASLEGGVNELLVYKEDDTDPKYYEINTVEALANVKYDYMNYFNKKLYFYKDEFKEELIGSVTCTSENEIASSEDKYTACNVATDTIYETNDMVSQEVLDRKSTIPIIHDKYVFIKDGKEIKIYDLTNSKKAKGTYTSVSSYTANNDNKLSLTGKDTYVVALNKKGKYGLLHLTKNTVEALVTFEYTGMEVVGDYVVGKKSASSYDVYKLGSDTALVTINGALKGYSVDKRYIKYVADGAYVVADFQGNELNSTRFDYVELYNGYYVGIVNKELNIYSYTTGKITEESLKVGNYKYVRVTNPAFKVSKKDGNYVVNIYNGSGYDENIYNTTINSYGEEKEPDGQEPAVPADPETETNTEESGS